MDDYDLSNVALEARSNSDLERIARETGMMGSRQRGDREQMLRQIRAWRDNYNTSERGLEQGAAPHISWGTWLCINIQAFLTAVILTGWVWYFSGIYIYDRFVPVYGLKGALELRSWLDPLCPVVFVLLWALWYGPAKKLGPMYFYLPSPGASPPSNSDPRVERTEEEEEPTSVPAEGEMERDIAGSASGENDAQPSRGASHPSRLNSDTRVETTEEEPTSVPAEDLQNLQRLTEQLMAEKAKTAALKGKVQEVEKEMSDEKKRLGERTEEDEKRRIELQKLTEQLAAEKAKTAASEDKILKMEEKMSDEEKRLEEKTQEDEKRQDNVQQLAEQLEAEKVKTAASEESRLKVEKEMRDEKKRLGEKTVEDEKRQAELQRLTEQLAEQLAAEKVKMAASEDRILKMDEDMIAERSRKTLEKTEKEDGNEWAEFQQLAEQLAAEKVKTAASEESRLKIQSQAEKAEKEYESMRVDFQQLTEQLAAEKTKMEKDDGNMRAEFQQLREQLVTEKAKTEKENGIMRAELQQLKEQVVTEKAKLAASEESRLKIQSQAEKIEKDYENMRAELIRLRGKVWIYLRLRPKVNTDQENQYVDLTSPDDFDHSLVLPGDLDTKHPQDTRYEFDRVFHDTDTNRDIYKHVRPMVQEAVGGLDMAIILEGPSGSGKSHTLFGPDGIAFSLARHILQSANEGDGRSIKITNFKVYKEKILDATILKGENAPFHIKDVKGSKIQVYRDQRYKSRVDGTLISTTEELTSEFTRMLNAREQRETAQNATSSRGHAVCKLEFSSSNVSAVKTKSSTLFLVDLAGPESFKQSQSPDETKTITHGRTELQHRLCEMIEIHQLDDNSEKRKKKTEELRIQLKNSKLTHILQDCFLGEPRILVIGTVNPYAAAEHRPRIRETFDFAKKIRNVGATHGHHKATPKAP